MPFPQSLRDKPPSKGVTNLYARMAQLLAPPAHHQRPPAMLPRQPQIAVPKPNIVEISDDSSSPSPPPQRPTLTAANLRRHVVSVHSLGFAEEESLDAQSDDDSDDSGPLALHRHKRPKLLHSPPARLRVQSNAPQPPLPTAATPPKQHPRLTMPRNKPALAEQVNSSHRFEPALSHSFRSNAAPLEAHDMFHPPLPPPYYYDTKLDVEMYRGPGYEAFPVALGTVKGHREAVENWKGKGEDLDFTSGNANDEHPSRHANTYEGQCIQRVLEIFPDVETDFVLQKIRDPNTQADVIEVDAEEDILVTRIISQLADMDQYPKVKPSNHVHVQPPIHDETGVTVPYDKALRKDILYTKEAVRILATEFTHVPTHYINKLMHETLSLFKCYTRLRDMENEYYTKTRRPYVRTRQPRANLEKKYCKPAFEIRDETNHAQMVNEFQAARQHYVREELKKNKQKERDEAEALNFAQQKAAGCLVECQCCFDDEIPLNRSVSCVAEAQVHFFCFSCVAQLADTQIGMIRYEILCMDGSGCKAELSPEAVARAVTTKTLDKLGLIQQQAEIIAAGIEGLEQCPYCDFKAICEPIEEDSVFNCINPDCNRATCRRCKEESHIPLTCEEARINKGLNARHQVEEARTESVLRKCPKCGVPIIKELGCNKMVCTSCRCLMCYVCKKDITSGQDGGYEHFNKRGSKCKLHDEHGVDRHEVEADEAEKEAIKKAKAEDADLDEKQLYVDTGPGQKKPKKPSAVPQLIPGMPPPLLRMHQDLNVAQVQLEQMRQAMRQREAQREVQRQFEVQAVFQLPAGARTQAHLRIQAPMQADAAAAADENGRLQRLQAFGLQAFGLQAFGLQAFGLQPNPGPQQDIYARAPDRLQAPVAAPQEQRNHGFGIAGAAVGPTMQAVPDLNAPVRNDDFVGRELHGFDAFLHPGDLRPVGNAPAPPGNVNDWLIHDNNDLDLDDLDLFFGGPVGGELPGAWRRI